MFRYLVLIWDCADAEAVSTAIALEQGARTAARGWERVWAAPGCVAYHAGVAIGTSRTVALRDAGVVFGWLFDRSARGKAALEGEIGAEESARILKSAGRRIVERYWGRYVAVLHDRAAGTVDVVRDPLGSLPSLTTRYRGVDIVCSDLEDCLQIGLRTFTVNWRYIHSLVAYSGLQIRDTALNEVSEIQFGERVRFRAGRMERSIEWNPIEIARREPIADPAEAMAGLRRETRDCIHAWAASHPAILHNLSGGLDSSIVLSCLVDAPTRPKVTCLHYFGGGPDEDERKYARLMATHAGVELIEHRLDPSEVRIEELLKLRPTPRPWFYLHELEHAQLEADLATLQGATTAFSGAGGDGIFFQARAELAVADYLFDHGLSRNLLEVAVDAARMSRKSVWPLLAQALRARVQPGRWHPMTAAPDRERSVVKREVLESARKDPSLLHPWFTSTGLHGVPPGILWHVMTVCGMPTFYSAFAAVEGPERTLPLLSQPVLEWCLRIPTYVLIRSGLDRAMARRAFASALPREIVARRGKGHVDAHTRDTLDRNLDFVRGMLLDGRLVREGILDADALALYLDRGRSPADFQYGEILQEHLCVEAWLSHWLDGRQRECRESRTPQIRGVPVTSSGAGFPG